MQRTSASWDSVHATGMEENRRCRTRPCRVVFSKEDSGLVDEIERQIDRRWVVGVASCSADRILAETDPQGVKGFTGV